MIDDKILTLLRALRQATSVGKINWFQVGEGDHAFRALVSNGTVEIQKGLDAEDQPFFDLTILDHAGNRLETVMVDTGEELKLTNDLYVLARRKALRLDDFLDRMISDVASLANS